MSLNYLDRSYDDVNRNFILVSYSHGDNQPIDAEDEPYIESILKRLFDKGADFWYDKDLVIGNDWKEKVKSRLDMPNCVGALLFASKRYLLSGACQEEMEWLMERPRLQRLIMLVGENLGVGSDAKANLLYETEAFKYSRGKSLESLYSFVRAAQLFRLVCADESLFGVVGDQESETTLLDAFKVNHCLSDAVEEYDVLRRNGLLKLNADDGTYYIGGTVKPCVNRSISDSAIRVRWIPYATTSDSVLLVLPQSLGICDEEEATTWFDILTSNENATFDDVKADRIIRFRMLTEDECGTDAEALAKILNAFIGKPFYVTGQDGIMRASVKRDGKIGVYECGPNGKFELIPAVEIKID